MNKTAAAHISLFLSMLIYAAGFSIIKEVSPEYLGSQGFVLLRVLGATPLLWLSGLFFREKIERKDLRKLAVLSLFGVVINQSLFIKGMSLTSPISGAIIMITSPLLVLVIGNIVLKERITLLRLSGILLGLAGAATLVLTSSQTSSKEDDPLGDLYIFINAISWGIFLVLVKPLMAKYHTITILKWVFLFSVPVLALLGFADVREVSWQEFSGRIWFDLLFVVFAVTFIAYLMNIYALSALSPAVVSAYIYLQP
ncbi:MAG TPA: DMT family transporter, partial [Bacteroidia bacterium]|nr:DMT family transporter [Bacteroidia bacterium]